MHPIRSDIETIDPSLVPFLVSEIDTTMYGLVAILTLLVYDTIITMDKEINYFWGSPCKFVSLIYFMNIHLPLIIVSDILLMRVLALYHQTDKKLTTCLRTLFGMEAAFGLGLLVYSNIFEEISVGRLAEDAAVCLLNRSPKVWGALACVVTLLYAIILMVPALSKAAQHWRESAGFSQFNLLKVLIQDQAIYFLLAIFCSVMGIVSYQFDIRGSLLVNLLSLLAYPRLLSALGSYLLIHLKEAGERRASGGTSFRMRTMTSIGFS
ncbi:hypothetical protein DFH11DRAFT_1515640 [Phellopilus nigrolimitatus]|nr:hypothetical protein DFH11DRAFT_1515640 [Phellopilus nigrolimitatus]